MTGSLPNFLQSASDGKKRICFEIVRYLVEPLRIKPRAQAHRGRRMQGRFQQTFLVAQGLPHRFVKDNLHALSTLVSGGFKQTFNIGIKSYRCPHAGIMTAPIYAVKMQ
jgi:hypothetical protein